MHLGSNGTDASFVLQDEGDLEIILVLVCVVGAGVRIGRCMGLFGLFLLSDGDREGALTQAGFALDVFEAHRASAGPAYGRAPDRGRELSPRHDGPRRDPSGGGRRRGEARRNPRGRLKAY